MSNSSEWKPVVPVEALDQLKKLSEGVRAIAATQFRAEASRLRSLLEAARKRRAAEAFLRK